MTMRLARWLVALPFLGILIGTAFVNQVEPLVLGMPFVLAWIVGWVVVGAAAMALIYAIDPINSAPEREDGGERS
jgi:xanthosine utilization system XapX-like protein